MHEQRITKRKNTAENITEYNQNFVFQRPVIRQMVTATAPRTRAPDTILDLSTTK